MAAALHVGAPGEGGKSLADRRRHVRVEVRLEVGFSIAGEEPGTLTGAVTHDISHGGACLAVADCPEQLAERLARRPLLNILIDIPRTAADSQGRTVLSSIQGRVEWLRCPVKPDAPVQIGIEFCGLDAAAETAVIDLIAHLLLGSAMPFAPDAADAVRVQSLMRGAGDL